MLPRLLQTTIAHLPTQVQFELRRLNFSRQIKRGRFVPHEPEIAEITRYLRAGDWAIDVGANVGHYTCHMARCVGPYGRVLAFEPIPTSFALLASNVRTTGVSNVTLFNVAVSSRAGLAEMTVPSYDRTQLRNYYQARIASGGELRVVCLPLDLVPIHERVRLVKIDAEGHDLQVLQGMQAIVERDRPVLVVESSPNGPAAAWVRDFGYTVRRVGVGGGFNIIAEPTA